MTKDIILILVVAGGVLSFFYNPSSIDAQYLQMLMAGIVGYFIGGKQVPVMSAFKRK